MTEEIKMDESGITQDDWDVHTHDGEEQFPHVHVSEADWSVSFGIPMTLRYSDDMNVIDLMEFRGVAMNMGKALEERRAVTDLETMTEAQAQFAVIAYNADRMLVDSLMNVVDQGLAAHGVNPPCQLQTVESSNLRSFGFVMEQAEGAEFPTKGTLYVAFKGDTLYAYEDVPIEVANRLIEADSKGRFFQQFVKAAGYEFRKVAG